METRTYYFPANAIGRHVLNYLVEHVSCSIGSIRKVNNTLAVTITTPTREITKVERVLQIYDLI
jgi:hypothetical protein